MMRIFRDPPNLAEFGKHSFINDVDRDRGDCAFKRDFAGVHISCWILSDDR